MVFLKRLTPVLGLIFLFGCASYRPAELISSLNNAKVECSSKQWTSASAEVGCYDTKEQIAWSKYAPDYQVYYMMLKNKRDELAQQVDLKYITPQQFKEQFAAHREAVFAQMRQNVENDSALRRQQEADLEQSMRNFAAATSAYYAAKAAAAPRTQTTNCQQILQQIQCTTTSY